MVEEIYEIKNEFIQKMRQEIDERGIERVDVGDMYKLADIVKDLAEAEKSCWEAEYYRSVAEAMEGGSGAQMGYSGMYGMQQGSRSEGMRSGAQSGTQSGYRDSMGRYARRGYGSGYQEHIDALKMEMQNADPQRREMMANELRNLM